MSWRRYADNNNPFIKGRYSFTLDRTVMFRVREIQDQLRREGTRTSLSFLVEELLKEALASRKEEASNE